MYMCVYIYIYIYIYMHRYVYMCKWRRYELGESLGLLCALPWRLYAGGATLEELQVAEERQFYYNI